MMTRVLKALLLVAVVFSIILIGILYYWIRVNTSIPQSPQFPYFPYTYSTINDSKWRVKSFQPVYKGYYYNDDGWLLLKTAYRDANGKIRQADVFFSGNITGKRKVFVEFDYGKGFQGRKEIYEDTLTKNLETGDQIFVGYIVKTSELPAASDKTCKSIPNYCNIAVLAEKQADEITKFELGENSINNKDFILPAFIISKELRSE